MDRAGAGDDAPPEHPLLEAARNSSDPEWRNTFFLSIPAADDTDWTAPAEDLSE